MTTVLVWVTASIPRRSSSRRPVNCSARNSGLRVRFKKPGPAISTAADTAQFGATKDLLGDVARGTSETLGERHHAVRLVIASVEVRRTGSAPLRACRRRIAAVTGACRRSTSWTQVSHFAHVTIAHEAKRRRGEHGRMES